MKFTNAVEHPERQSVGVSRFERRLATGSTTPFTNAI